MPQTYTFLTVQNARDDAINETIGSSSSALTALQEASMIRQVDLINRRFVTEGHLRHPSGGWSWMQETTLFQTKSNTTLNGAITTSTTTITLTSGTDFDSSGRIWIEEKSTNSIDFVDYTGKSTNNLTGATKIDISHADDQRVEKLYGVPSDYAKTIRMFVDSQEYHFDRSPHLLPPAGAYRTEGAFFLMPRSLGAKDVTLIYQKSPLDLSTGVTATDDAKSIDIPEEFYRYMVEKLKAYIWNVRRKEEKVGIAFQLAEQELDRAFAFDVSETGPSGIIPHF